MPRPTLGSLQQYYSDAAAQQTDYEAIENAIANGDPIIESWTMSCVESMKYPLKAIQSLLDPEAIIFAGRLPDALQKKLSENIHIAPPSFGGLTAPKPKICVSGGSNILELGVTSIPAFYFFNR